jgi:hypothetical protein
MCARVDRFFKENESKKAVKVIAGLSTILSNRLGEWS